VKAHLSALLLLVQPLWIGSLFPSPACGAEASADFRAFVDDYFAARFRTYPTEATSAGLHEHDGELENPVGAFEGRVLELKRLLARLGAIDHTKLTPDEAIDARVLEGVTRAELLDLETIRTWTINPTLYITVAGSAIDSLMKREFAPARDRLRAVIARERAIPSLFNAARRNLDNPPREFTDLALRAVRGSVGFFEGAVADWAKTAAGSDTALWNEFDEANARVAAETKALATWLETDLKPRSTGRYAIGPENFLAKLKYEEDVAIALPELLARGEAQLAKDGAAFIAVARQIDAARSPAEVMKSLSDDHPTADDLIASVRRSVEAARAFLIAKGIVTVPSDVLPRIEETPPYARVGSFASMDPPGPFETKAREAFYYVTPVEKDWDAKRAEEHLRLYNPPVVALLNAHEAYPGHYLQLLYSPRYPTKTRKLIFCGTNVEGWAHYCEQMMVDEGFGGGDPRVRLAQLQEALLRDCRYVVGIKLHTEGWTVEQGARVFVEKAYQEPANAYEEARRGAYNPTYLYYTLGKLQILELRAEYLAKKPGATLRQFHDAFVAQGGLPIRHVRAILFRP
jgi:uncharacterized protein (DUF885 family)